MDAASSDEKNTIGIIILNYNGLSKNVDCLNSIFSQNYKYFKIVFVDNNSEDNSIQLIQQYCMANSIESVLVEEARIDDKATYTQKLIIIKNSQNKGYSYGNNVGLKFAEQHLKNLNNILILNNDVILPVDFLNKLLQQYLYLQEKYDTKKIALGTPEYSFKRKKIHTGFHYLNLVSGLVFKYPIPPYYSYLVGSSIFLDNDPPFFDDTYFLYFDDAEYTRILKNHNYKIAKVKNNFFFHDQGFTTKKLKDLTSIMYSSMSFFYRKHYSGYIPIVFAVRYCINLIKGNFKKNKLLFKYYFRNKSIKSY